MSQSTAQVADPGFTPPPDYSNRIATIEVGQSSSHCSACGRGVSIGARRHTWCLGYGPQGPGCGATFAIPKVGRVYVASSWRNQYQQLVCATLNAASIDHYDFTQPGNGRNGFSWKEVMPSFDIDEQLADVDEYLAALNHPRAVEGYNADFEAMTECDTFVMVLPCGKSAHLELGWAVGAGKRTAIFLVPESRRFLTLSDQSRQTERVMMPHAVQPELMYKMADLVTHSLMDLLAWLGVKD